MVPPSEGKNFTFAVAAGSYKLMFLITIIVWVLTFATDVIVISMLSPEFH